MKEYNRQYGSTIIGADLQCSRGVLNAQLVPVAGKFHENLNGIYRRSLWVLAYQYWTKEGNIVYLLLNNKVMTA